jgi:uncharacterized protein (TIGR03435 family)
MFSLVPLALSQTVRLDACIPDPASAASIPKLTYDVVSIRPHDPEDGTLGFSGSDGDAAHGPTFNITGVALKNLIEIAYGVDSFQVAGGPATLMAQRFDVRAKSDDSAGAQLAGLTRCQVSAAKQQMLQTVLADRFKLTVHRGTKEVTAYNLVVAKSGAKLTASPPLPAEPEPEHPRGARSEGRGDHHGTRQIYHDFPMQQLASTLTAELNLPVADKTGLSGVYDFTLQWSSDDTSREDPYPSLFTAIQEQLGLKLEPTKAPIDVIVIEHIEPPSEN